MPLHLARPGPSCARHSSAPRRGRGPARGPPGTRFGQRRVRRPTAGRSDGPHDRRWSIGRSRAPRSCAASAARAADRRLAKASPGGMLGIDFHLGGDGSAAHRDQHQPGRPAVQSRSSRGRSRLAATPWPGRCRAWRRAVSRWTNFPRVAGSFREEWASERGPRHSTASRSSTTTRPGSTCIPSSCSTSACSSAPAGARRSSTPAARVRGDGLYCGRRAHRPRLQPSDGLLPGRDRHAALRQAYEDDLAVISPASRRARSLGRQAAARVAARRSVAARCRPRHGGTCAPAADDSPNGDRASRCSRRLLAASQGIVLQAGRRLRRQGGLPRRQAHALDLRAHPRESVRGPGLCADVDASADRRRAGDGVEGRHPQLLQPGRRVAACGTTLSRTDHELPDEGRRVRPGAGLAERRLGIPVGAPAEARRGRPDPGPISACGRSSAATKPSPAARPCDGS